MPSFFEVLGELLTNLIALIIGLAIVVGFVIGTALVVGIFIRFVRYFGGF